jgi:hypothetical protein
VLVSRTIMTTSINIECLITTPLGLAVLRLDSLVSELVPPRGMTRLKNVLESRVWFIMDRAGRAEMSLNSSSRATNLEQIVERLGALRYLVGSFANRKASATWCNKMVETLIAVESIVKQQLAEIAHPQLREEAAATEAQSSSQADGSQGNPQQATIDGAHLARLSESLRRGEHAPKHKRKRGRRARARRAT